MFAGKEATKCLRHWVSEADMSNLNCVFSNGMHHCMDYIYCPLSSACDSSIPLDNHSEEMRILGGQVDFKTCPVANKTFQLISIIEVHKYRHL